MINRQFVGVVAVAVGLLWASGTGWALDIPITVQEPSGLARTAEPVSGGIPMPWAEFKADQPFALFDGDKEVPLQAVPLVTDEQGFLRWILVDFQADLKAKEKKTFTLRTAKAVAKVQRALERRIQGKGDEGEDVVEPPKPDEKKLRCDKCGRVIPPWSEFCPVCMSRRKVLSRLLDFVKPYKGRAILGFALALAVTLMGLVRPWLTKPMLDKGLGLGGTGPGDYPLLLFFVVIMAVLTILSAIAYIFLVQFGQVLGMGGVLPPVISMWMANTVFFAAGVALLWRAWRY